MTLKPLSKTFGIKIYNLSPDKIVINSEFSIDVSVDEVTRGFLVSKFEENSIRQSIGYTKGQWRELTPADRADEIAVYRINKKMEYVKSLKEMDKI